MILCLSPQDVDIHTEWETAHFIVHKRESNCHCIAGGSLSIKMALDGRILHHIGHRLHAIDDDGYLIVNEGDLYEVTKEAPYPVEAFSVYFETGFANDVIRSLEKSADDLLGDPFWGNDYTIEFFERIYPHDKVVSPILFGIRDAIIRQQVTWRWFEDQLYRLMEGMLWNHKQVSRKVDQLSAVRRSTREEVYRRLYHARDFAIVSISSPITIKDMARVALMSPSYFLRTFQELFHQTPYQFIQTQRLERAEKLLMCSDYSITAIAQACGFERVSSFSWFFSQRFGMSPRQYRVQNSSA